MEYNKLTYRILIGTISLLFTLHSCIDNDVPIQKEKAIPICWNVIPEEMKEGRTLINTTENLQTACSTGGHAIGIWSAYTLGGIDTQHVLGNENGDVNLIYQPDQTQDWQKWSYGKTAYWIQGATYYFNAYFPMNGGLTNIQHTKDYIQGNYNTETTQTDLMVTRVTVPTSSHGSPVALPMRHALATVQFKFQMEAGSETVNVLKSFSLDKTLRTSANLNYTTGNITIDHWTDKKASANNRIYAWNSNTGIEFSVTDIANPYQGNDNDGHILIIPQSCNDAPTFSCTIGTHTYENISLGTKLFEPGKNYIYLIKMKDNILNVNLHIKAWNELDSSYDIIF